MIVGRESVVAALYHGHEFNVDGHLIVVALPEDATAEQVRAAEDAALAKVGAAPSPGGGFGRV